MLTSLLAPLVTSGVPETTVPFADLGKLIATLIQVALLIGGLATFGFLILAGIEYITSGGDKVGTAAAREKIIAAVTGLAIIVAAYALTRVIEAVFGITILGAIRWPGPESRVGQ